MKFCYLKQPNPLHDIVIGAPDTLPKEFGLDEYLDYNLQFEKTFLGPITSVLDAIGWKLEKEHTLESFFE